MTSYFHKHYGNLFPGHTAYSEDIMAFQQKTEDAFNTSIDDLNGNQGCILGGDENAFILTPESKRAGRYIDQINLADGTDGVYVSFRQTTYRQPILLSRTSLYSIILKFQNKSEKDITVVCELQNEFGDLILDKKSYVNVPANTDGKEFEVVFDLDYYPTAHGLSPQEVSGNDPKLRLPNEIDTETQGVGTLFTEPVPQSNTAGASELYLVIRGLNQGKDNFDVNQTDSNNYQWNDDDPTFGILMNRNSTYGQLLEEDTGSGYTTASTPGDLFFKSIYANSPCYHCEEGEAIVGGHKVVLADTHVVVAGANSYGNVLSYIYMDIYGHLYSKNSEVFIGAEPVPEPPEEPHLHIANIITYADDDKDPKVIQDDDNQDTRLRSHHERLRRIENKIDWTQDIAIPPRFKYTLTGEDWIDTKPEVNLYSTTYNHEKAQDLDALDKNGYNIATDSDGNTIIKMSSAESFNIPVTLKSKTSGTITKVNGASIIKSAQTSTYINNLGASDITRAQTFATIENMNIDVDNGVMTLAQSNDFIVATTNKEAKQTTYYPWDDNASNRPKSAKNVKPTERSFSVVSGKNGKNDWVSEFPGMTLYFSKSFKLTKLQIPIYKFKNCDSVKFILYKRQSTNNQTNTVWFEKRIDSKTFSLKKAKTKNGYQYMEDGFLWDFGKGKTLEKGQYVIVAFPTVKSGTGTIYIETYKPEKSSDFLIRYHGAANASHFLLKTRYHEIWYNSAKAIGAEVEYEKKGYVESGTVTWENKEPIKTIKPMINLSGTGVTLYVDTGAGWTKMELNKANNITGSKDSFRWKLEFKGNGKKTPTVSYNKKNKYAIKFEITRQEPQLSNMSQAATIDKNLCITSKPFDGDDILRQYIGDINFALTNKRFSNYEFARVWATEATDALSIDISASDREDDVTYTENNTTKHYIYPVYSLHYVDLKLSDFNNNSVDYSNYDPQLEIDEHNLRLKLDTDYSYNDDDIQIININEFKVTDDTFLATETELEKAVPGLAIALGSIVASETNTVIAKAKLDSPVNLGQYDGIKLGFTLNGSVGGTLSGLGLYLSSAQEVDAPSNLNNEPTDINDNGILTPEDTLPDLNSAQEDIIKQYGNTIIKRYEPRNGSAGYVYYKSVWDSANQKWEWQLLHDVKPYKIFELCDRTDNGALTITNNNNGIKQYYEVDIDGDSINMQNIQEIGLIALNDEGKYKATNVSSIKLNEFRSIQHDYYTVFDASNNDVFTTAENSVHHCYATGKIHVVIGGTSKTDYETEPKTTQVAVLHQSTNSAGETVATFGATSKNTEGFNHIGIQLACDCAIVKNMFEIELRKIDSSTNTKTVIDRIKLPTLNQAYYPTNSEKSIPLVQIFKKLRTTDRFDEIAIVTTSKFKDYAKQLKTVNNSIVNGADGNQTINLFIGKIVLYQARTIPMFHPRMRMKFYMDNKYTGVDRDITGIRKIGVVIDYQ